MRKDNLVGLRFGKLTVICEDGRIDGCVGWVCKCDCGNYIRTQGWILKAGKTVSCGCVKKSNMSNLNKRPNIFEFQDDVGICHFNNGNEYFIFDKEDYEKLKDYCWYKNNTGYAIHDRNNQKSILAHRLIMDCPDGLIVDHINHDTLDNRKSNLRICTSTQNMMNSKLRSDNTSGYTGVSLNRSIGKWESYINVNRKRIKLGFYSDLSDAIEARKEAEKELFGEYAYKGKEVI